MANDEMIIGHGGSNDLNRSRGKAIGALCIVVILAFGTTAIVNNITEPKKPKVVTIAPAKIATVQITDQGFNPATITINKGTVISWEGKQAASPVVIASNPYPKNDSLPTLKSTQLGQGANYRYKFDQIGTFSYHDDLNPNINGFIIVK